MLKRVLIDFDLIDRLIDQDVTTIVFPFLVDELHHNLESGLGTPGPQQHGSATGYLIPLGGHELGAAVRLQRNRSGGCYYPRRAWIVPFLDVSLHAHAMSSMQVAHVLFQLNEHVSSFQLLSPRRSDAFTMSSDSCVRHYNSWRAFSLMERDAGYFHAQMGKARITLRKLDLDAVMLASPSLYLANC